MYRSKITSILILLICLFTFSVAILKRPVYAQSLSSLSSEVFGLKARLNQLENQVRSLSNSNLRQPSNTPSLPNPQIQPNPSLGASDPMFERLATLVIELKERVTALEKRTEKLEQLEQPEKQP